MTDRSASDEAAASPPREPDRPDRRARPSPWFAVGIVVAVVALDQLSKVWAVANLSDGRTVDVLGDSLQFRLSRNTGASFSLFAGFTPFLAVLAIGVAVWLGLAVRRTTDRWMLVALALVLGGALGNLIDRVFRSPGFLRGGVVDFIYTGWWPTFNVADSAITVGAILLVWRVWRTDRSRV